MLGQGSTGAANDLAKATDLAIKMVREFGLSSAVGPVGYPSGGSVFLDGGGGAFSSRPFAEQTQAAIDAEVSRLLGEAEHRAMAVLNEHREVLDRLVDLLLAKETVDGSEVYALAGRSEPVGGAGVTMAPDRKVAAADDSNTDVKSTFGRKSPRVSLRTVGSTPKRWTAVFPRLRVSAWLRSTG